MRRLVPALCACALLSCTTTTQLTGTFNPQEQPHPPAADVLVELAAAPARPAPAPVVAGVTANGELFVWDFESGIRWRREVAARSAPLLAGDTVVTEEGDGRIVVRALSDGTRRFAIDEDGARLVGADAAGGVTAVSLLVELDDRERGLVVLGDADGVRWETELSRPVGPPAVVGRFVVAPWGTLHISLLRQGDGTEAQRVSLRDSVAGHAFVDRGQAFVGQHGLLRVDRELESGTREDSTYYSPEARPLPGQPGMLRDAYEPVPPPSHAGHRVRLDWRVADGVEQLSLQDDKLYLHFYRFVFALDAERDAVDWLYQGPQDVTGTAVVRGGIYLVDAAGDIRFLNALGHPVWSGELGIAPVVTTLRVPDGAPGAEAAAASPAAASGDDEAAAPAVAASAAEKVPETPPPAAPAAPGFVPRPLQQQLVDAARLDDARLAGGRAFAVDHLARFEDASVTDVLLTLCDDSAAPDLVRLAACRQLTERTRGEDAILAALSRRADHRGHVPPPPVGALSGAAVTMKLKPAAPHLLAHLQDPQTPARDLAPAIHALGVLAHRPAAPVVTQFLQLHHAEPDSTHMRQALTASVDTLTALRGKAARSTLQAIIDDPFTSPPLVNHTKAALAALDAPKRRKKSDAEAAKDGKKDGPEKARLRYLSMDVVARVMRPAQRRLRRCLVANSAGAVGARISMVVHGDGHIERVFVTPTESQACIEKAVGKLRFPASAGGRQQVVHVVRPRGRAAAKRGDAGKGKSAPKKGRTRIEERAAQ